MSKLLVEIGSTAVKAAWCDGVTLGRTLRYQGEDWLKFIRRISFENKPSFLVLASSRNVSENDINELNKICDNLLVLDSKHPEVLDRYGLPQYLTYDRAASIVAVRHMFSGQACTVFDFGSSLTIDVTDSAGNYLGGNVSPGCRTRFKAVNRYSRFSLPLVDTPENINELGCGIESSIESGVISGIMFELEGYASRYPHNVLVYTGGDAIYFAKRSKLSIFAICNLVLIGLAYITDDYVGKE